MKSMSSKRIRDEIEDYLNKLFPLCRSITGDGNRQTLRILQEIIPLKIYEVPTGTRVYDWIVPKEWVVRNAWIANESGRRIVDFNQHNLHLMGYSVPVKKK